MVRTETLSKSVDRLAAFLSIPAESIDNERSHLHRCPRDHGVVARLSPSLVQDKMASHCEAVLSRITALTEAQTGRP